MLNIFNPFNKSAEPSTIISAPVVPEPVAPEQHTVVAIPTSVAGDASTASEQVTNAVAHDLQCTLTIGEAQQLFRTLLRRPLSQRSLQRYCNTGTIAAQMISHSQGKEWLLNETSLRKFIETYPITLTDDPTATAPLATPETAPEPRTQPDAVETAQPQHSPAATPEPANMISEALVTDDGDDYADPTEVGESRHLGEVLIENARLAALLSGKDEVISTLKSHDVHMRTQLKESTTLTSKLTGDVVNIASQMLNTMQAIGTAGRNYTLQAAVEDDKPLLVSDASRRQKQDR
jgi:hypothetical protein